MFVCDIGGTSIEGVGMLGFAPTVPSRGTFSARRRLRPCGVKPTLHRVLARRAMRGDERNPRPNCPLVEAQRAAFTPVNASICDLKSGWLCSRVPTSPCSTSGGSTPGHSVLASRA